MRVALVHDFLTEYGGAERVLEALHELWPNAPVYTAFYNPESLGVQAKRFEGWNIITSWGSKLPLWRQLLSPYRVFSKSFFEHFDLSGFDLVISSSNAYMAKAVKVPNGVHICYCHTPPRFLYGYATAVNWRKNPILRIVGEVLNHVMRVWDWEAAQRVDYFIANSREVSTRIKKFYRKDSEVIYPPVDTGKFEIRNSKPETLRDYFLVVSRLVAAKRVDLAVRACAKLGLPLKVVGGGRELESLKNLAASVSDAHPRGMLSRDQAHPVGGERVGSIEFLGEVADDELIGLYQNCRAVIFPAEQEDFGLVPVEAMAAGKPVIARAEGGILETVIDGKTGVYFESSTGDSLESALKKFLELEKKNSFDSKFIRKHAEQFSAERFKGEIKQFVKTKVKNG